MRRYARRADKSQPAIVAALRAVGASVKPFAPTKGEPDLLVGYRGVNYLLECKTPGRERHDLAHTAQQAAWHAGWRGLTPTVVSTPQEALKAILAA